MKKILALTLGGSSEPIVASIKAHNPDKVLFFVTTSPNGGSKKKLLEKVDGEESIITRTALPASRYEVHEIQFPDELTSCYTQMKEAMLNSAPPSEEYRRIADYTGGTKTMAVSLVIAALDLNWQLSIVKGERTNLNKALNGTEIACLVSTSSLLLERTLNQAEEFFNLGQYEAVESMLRSFLSEEHTSEEEVSRVQRLLTLSRAFAAWDRFEHAKALPILEAQARLAPQHVRSLKELLGKSKGSGYEKVWDLIKNAQRRADQGHYDDAVLRLYRTLELFAQIRLEQEYGLDTSDLDLDKIPVSAHRMFSWQKAQGRKRITAGLFDAYRILAALGDPVGTLYEKKWAGPIKDVLERRNRSILAHGTQPVGREVWGKAYEITNGFLTEAAAEIRVRSDWLQFPKWDEVKEAL